MFWPSEEDQPLAWHLVKAVFTKARFEDYPSERACQTRPPSEAAMPQNIVMYVSHQWRLLEVGEHCICLGVLICLLQAHEAVLVIASSCA